MTADDEVLVDTTAGTRAPQADSSITDAMVWFLR